ncbi:CPBP family intramembrane glutamic endopeptidase [Variovorax sp. dw_954]|uniref:CPBP family intramembrane glutamic endopeptidase n=1 Tax=Variovorax sp. dw_954 TaxID=2720078 RepID=UPI001BD5DC17|nr:CPBP family intramembrane glutamic endopeptidase [Variovorax sp. dw_954]
MQSPEGEAFPTAFQAVLLYVALLLCELLVGAALRDMRSLARLTAEQISALTLVLANGCVFVVVMHFQNISYRSLFHHSSASRRATLALVVPPVLLLVPALMLTISTALELLVRIAPMSAWEERLFQRMGDSGIASLIAACILAPVLEEMLFRGIVLRGFLRQYSRWHAILGSAVLFGAAHLNIYQFVVGIAMGVVLGWLYERTRSLIPCIALHVAYNSGLVAMGRLVNSQSDAMSAAGVATVWLVSLAVAGCGTMALRRMLSPRPR